MYIIGLCRQITRENQEHDYTTGKKKIRKKKGKGGRAHHVTSLPRSSLRTAGYDGFWSLASQHTIPVQPWTPYNPAW